MSSNFPRTPPEFEYVSAVFGTVGYRWQACRTETAKTPKIRRATLLLCLYSSCCCSIATARPGVDRKMVTIIVIMVHGMCRIGSQ